MHKFSPQQGQLCIFPSFAGLPRGFSFLTYEYLVDVFLFNYRGKTGHQGCHEGRFVNLFLNSLER